MKVAIDITPLESKHQVRGIGFYTKNLIEALKRQNKENEYIFFTRGQKLPKDVTLVHYPYFDPFFLTLSLRKSFPTLVTVHDLIPLVFPDKFPRGLKGEIKWQIQKWSLKGASAIIADSECSKKDVVKFTGMSQGKIHVVYLAPGQEFRKLKIENYKLKIKQKYQLPDTFVLYVGDVNYNKNIPGLIKAFYKLKTTNQKLKLVFVGKAFMDENLMETKELLQLINQLNLKNEIRFLGFVPTQDLVGIYNLATVYVQPSFYEGFGLPVLEAMACGTPVVAANTSSLPEICAEAAIMVNPYDENDIAQGLKKVLYDISISDLLRKRGFEQVKKFSWEKVVAETVEVYKTVIYEKT